MEAKRLAILGGEPRFGEALHVGRPNVGNLEKLRTRIDEIIDSRWFTNRGPYVRHFEEALQHQLQVNHVIAVCNATLGLEIATRAGGAAGEVIVPSFTFVATAHAIQWQGINPVFADICTESHVLDPSSVEQMITPKTTAILGTHIWGTACPTDALQDIADRHGLFVMYDAAHAVGCTHNGRPIGSNGIAEVFSFHATKYVNSFEGGAIATNDDILAEQVRSMVNFGFDGYDSVASVGTNAKMSEVAAAMGLTSLEAAPEFARWNRLIWNSYREGLRDLRGISIHEYSECEINSYQYVVLVVDEECPVTRDELVQVLHLENCLARRYFYPGVHRMEPYSSLMPMSHYWLPNTESLVQRVLILPTGTAVTERDVEQICAIIRDAIDLAPRVKTALAASSTTL